MTTDDGPPSVAPGATELAQLALRRYGLRDAQTSPLQQRGGTEVLSVVSPIRGKFVLRMFALQPAVEGTGDTRSSTTTYTLTRSPEMLRSQMLWLSYLRRETDLLVPEPVPTTDGSLVTSLSLEDLPWHRALLRRVWKSTRGAHPPDRHCVLLRWVPGRHKYKDLSAEDLSLIGSCLAGLHRHAERYSLPEGSVLPRWDWDWAFGERALLWGKGEEFYSASEMEVFEAAARRVRADLDELGYGRYAFGIIHRDPNLNNFLFHDGMVGVIDFDLCGLGHYLLDLTLVLVSLRAHNREAYAMRRETLLESYQRERPLPPNHKEYFRTFVAMRLVWAVNRELGYLGLESTSRPRSQQRSRGPQFLRNAVNRLEQLAKSDGAL